MKTDTSQELRVRILDEAARQFDKKGIKFTMDDLAHALGMSKKTIYTVFEDKRSIMTQTIDRFFDDALIEEEMILNDENLTIPEQLTAIIGRVPERYTQNDLSQLYVLKESQTLTGQMWNWRNQARVKTSPHSSFTISTKPWILQKCWSEGTQS